MTLAAVAAVGFAVAGIHAHLLRKDPRHLFHRRAVAIALGVGGVTAVLQPLSGDMSARHVARSRRISRTTFRFDLPTSWSLRAARP
jgi:cytochrome d ubiquinol oxidase subunit I